MKQHISQEKVTRSPKVSGSAAAKSRTTSTQAPATPDSAAIADHIKTFEYKARYSKNVLSKYQNLCRSDN